MISKEEAFGILGVTSKSTELDIEKRYAILIKRYNAEDNKAKLEEASLAYNIIKGIYVEPIKEDPKMQKVIFGKTRSQWKNIWYYGKIKYFIIGLVVAFIIYLTYTIITNTPADFKIAVIGEFATNDTTITENYVKGFYPQLKKVEIAPVYWDAASESSYYGSAYVQKIVILLTAAGEDVVVVDRATFDKYAANGAFKPIGDLYEKLVKMDETKALGLESAKATISANSDGSGTEQVYGIDVSKSQILDSIGISGREQIITISVKTEREELTREFITKLLTDAKQLVPKVTMVPAATPTPVPTLTPAPTPKS